jgi:hypothetical protein
VYNGKPEEAEEKDILYDRKLQKETAKENDSDTGN